jgi:glycosyltransferase involved in cell wall biosynthesis
LRKRIAIAILSDLYHETRLLRMVESLQQAGWQVTIISVAAAEGEHPFRDVEFIQLRLKSRRRLKRVFLSFMWQLFHVVRGLEVDCFLAIDPPALFPMALCSGCRPLIYDSREYYTELGTVVNRPLIKRFWYLLERFGIKRADRWLTVCSGIEWELRQLYDIAPGQVVRNVPRAQSPRKSDYLRQHFTILPDRTILLYQGGLWAAYDFEQLNRAVLQMPETVLVYLGDGPLLKPLEEWVATHNAEEQIHFHPRVVPQKLSEITASADAGVILIPPAGKSFWYLLPNKLFEYIQAGLPVLVSNFPEMEQLVQEYSIGLSVDPTDSVAIKQALVVLLAAIRSDEFSDGLKRAAQELNWEQEETAFMQVVRQLCD